MNKSFIIIIIFLALILTFFYIFNVILLNSPAAKTTSKIEVPEEFTQALSQWDIYLSTFLSSEYPLVELITLVKEQRPYDEIRANLEKEIKYIETLEDRDKLHKIKELYTIKNTFEILQNAQFADLLPVEMNTNEVPITIEHEDTFSTDAGYLEFKYFILMGQKQIPLTIIGNLDNKFSLDNKI